MCRVRVALLAGVSALAIAAVQPEIALAADMPSRPAVATKAAPATFRDRWTWWVEGGASLIEGDPGVAGMTGFDVNSQHVGWEAAGGFSFQPGGSPWIWSAQFRFSGFGSKSAANNPIGIFFPANGPPSNAVTGSNSASRNERRWVADFMVGRDLGLGAGQQIAKIGVRIAELRGKTKGSAQWSNIPASAAVTPASCITLLPTYCGSEVRDYTQKNQFLGAGPRIEFDGSAPLGGPWSLEYMAGIAALYGRRKVDQDVNVSHPILPNPAVGPPATLTSGGPIQANSSSYGFVFNIDAMLGLAFALNPNTALLVSYRFDGYFNALRGYDTNGNVTNLDRFYHGPMLRVVVTN